jgi:hypothetical protein
MNHLCSKLFSSLFSLAVIRYERVSGIVPGTGLTKQAHSEKKMNSAHSEKKVTF